MNVSKWIRTDDLQIVKKEADRCYHIIEIIGNEEIKYFLSDQVVCLDEYSDETIIDVIQGYGYSDIEEVKKLYLEEWEQVIAECLAETFWDFKEGFFQTKDKAEMHIEEIIRGE